MRLPPAVTVAGRVTDANGRPQPQQRVLVQLDFGSDPARSAHYRLFTHTNDEGRFSYAGFPVGTEGEVSVLHEKDGRLTGARTVVSFQVPDLEPIEVTDLIVPASGPANAPAPRPRTDNDRRP